MVYTDIQTLRGLNKPIDYGSGIEYATGLIENFGGTGGSSSSKSPQQEKQTFGLQVGLWLNGTQGCNDILDGTLDSNIEQMFQYFIVAVPDHVKIFLRVGYEFDNPYFGYSDSPTSYKNAYRYLVNHCIQKYDTSFTTESSSICRHKIAFVWHSWAAPRTISNINEFYPGDTYVDWIGISIFQQFYPWANDNDDGEGGGDNEFSGGSMKYVEEILEYAYAIKKKPIMIAESTPFGGIYLQDVNSTILAKYGLSSNMTIATTATDNIIVNNNTTYNPDDGQIDIWSLWFQPILDIIDKYDIGMWSYIDCNWNEQPMWHNIGFGDTRLVASSYVMDQWYKRVLSNKRFLNTLQCTTSGDSSTSRDSSDSDTSRMNHHHHQQENDPHRPNQHHDIVQQHHDEQYQQISNHHYRAKTKNQKGDDNGHELSSLFSFWNSGTNNNMEIVLPLSSSSSSTATSSLESSSSAILGTTTGGETNAGNGADFLPIMIGFVLLIVSVATTVHFSTKFGLMIIRQVAATTEKCGSPTSTTFKEESDCEKNCCSGSSTDVSSIDEKEVEESSWLGRHKFCSSYGSIRRS